MSLRSREEINKEYTECAMKLGDNHFKIRCLHKSIKLLGGECDELKRKMDALSEEKAQEPAVVKAAEKMTN
jgi:FtsZ-binding cell division protein ZapB